MLISFPLTNLFPDPNEIVQHDTLITNLFSSSSPSKEQVSLHHYRLLVRARPVGCALLEPKVQTMQNHTRRIRTGLAGENNYNSEQRAGGRNGSENVVGRRAEGDVGLSSDRGESEEEL